MAMMSCHDGGASMDGRADQIPTHAVFQMRYRTQEVRKHHDFSRRRVYLRLLVYILK